MTTMTVRALYDQMVGFASPENKHQDFTVTEFTRFLRNFVGTADIKVKTARDSNVDLDQVIISGFYDPDDDEEGLAAVTVYANYNPLQVTIRLADVNWEKICLDLIECVGHEVIHQHQFRNRNFDVCNYIFASKTPIEEKRDAQEYLGNPDEIEAYGYSIAIEMYLKYNGKKLTSKHVGQSQVFKTYCAAFGTNHIVVKNLLEYALKYFKHLNGEEIYVKEV